MKIFNFWRKPKTPRLGEREKQRIAQLKAKKDQYKAKIDNIDEEIIAIQRSTKTLVPQMVPLHNWMRMRYKWYYNWHLKSYVHKVHWWILSIYTLALIVAVILGAVVPPYRESRAAPVAIATPSASNATANSALRKTFYDTANSKHWTFYYDGSAIAYSYSTDSSSWTASSTLAYNTTKFYTTYKNISNVGYVYVATFCNTYDICVVKGTIGASSISWSTEYTALNGASVTDNYTVASIAFDGSNYLWVAGVYDGGPYADQNRYTTKVTKSTGVNDPSAWGAAASVGRASTRMSESIIIPQTGSNMNLTINGEGGNVVTYTYNGSTWTEATGGGSYGFYYQQGMFNSGVNAVAIFGGNVYVGGSFKDAVSSISNDYISYWDGTTWNPLTTGTSDVVRALAVNGSYLYVGGDFTTAGGTTVNRIAKWSGSAWSAVNTGTVGVNGAVYSIAFDASNDLYVGGNFTTAGGNAAARIAKYSSSTWSALGSGFGAIVRALEFDSSGSLYAGGTFTDGGGVGACDYLCKYSGGAWGQVDATGMGAAVYALESDGSGNIWAGGTFTTAGSCASNCNRIAKWSGSAWSAMGTGANGDVNALALTGTDLYAVGAFSTTNGSTSRFISKWNGSAWSSPASFASANVYNSSIYSIAINGTNIYCGGHFIPHASGKDAEFVFYNGSSWIAWGSSGLMSQTYTTSTDGSGNVYVGGYNITAGGNFVSNIAKWDGRTWSAMGSGLGSAPRDSYWDSSTSKLYVAGYFTTAGGSTANRVASWNGSAWSSVGTSTNNGVNADAYGIAVSGTKIYVVGNFTTAGTCASNCVRVAYFETSTSTWTAMGTGVTNGIVNKVAVDGSGNVYITGTFTDAGGNTSCDNVCMWNGSWTAMGTGLNGEGKHVLVDSTDIYVGGSFTTANGTTVNRIAKWNGSTWSALGSGTVGCDNTVERIVKMGTDFYVGGWFSSCGGTAMYTVGKWSGSAWSSLGNSSSSGGNEGALGTDGTRLYFGTTSRVNNGGSLNGQAIGHFGMYGPMSSATSDYTTEISAVNDSSGNVQLTYTDSSDYVNYRNYNIGSSTWSANTAIRSSASTAPSISINYGTGDLYAFWNESNNVYYKKYTLGTTTWDTNPTSLYSTGTNLLASSDPVNGGGIVKVIWTNGTGNPYNVYSEYVGTLTTFTWDGGGDGTSWSDANNWDLNASYPQTAYQKALINTGSASIATPAGGALTVGELELGSSYSGTLTLGHNLTIDNAGANGKLTMSNSSASIILNTKNLSIINTVSNSGTIKLGGDETLTMTQGNDTDSGTVEYTATSSTRAIKTLTYFNLKVNGSGGTFSLPAATTANGYFNLAAGTLTQGAYDFTVKGNFTIGASSATFTKGTGSAKLKLLGDLTFTGPATAQDLGVVEVGASPDSTTLASDFSATSLTIGTGDTLYTKGYEVDIGTGGISLTGTIDATDNGGAGYEADGTILTDAGAFTINVGGVFTKCVQSSRRSTVKLDSGTTQAITSRSNDMGDFQTATASTHVDLSDALTVDEMTIAASTTLHANNFDITVSESWTNSGTFTAGTDTVTFDATASGKTIATNVSSFYNLIFNGSGGEWTPSAAVTATNDLTMTAGSLLGTQNVTVGGNVAGTAGIINLTGGTFTHSAATDKNFGTTSGTTAWIFNDLRFYTLGSATVTTQTGGSGGITVTGSLTLDGDVAVCKLNAGNRVWTLSGTTGTPLSIAASANLISGTSTFLFTGNNGGGNTTFPAATYYNLQTNNGSETYVQGGAVTVSNDLTNTAGTYSTGTNYALNIGGSYSNSGTFTANTSTVTFTSTSGGKTLAGTMTGTSSFYKLIFNGSGGAWTFGANSATATNDFTITAGTVTAPSTTLTIGNSYSNSGAFTHNSGTVTFNATATSKTLAGTLNGASGFNNLIFNGSGGGWSNSAAMLVNGDLTVTAGTLSGTNNIVVYGGDITGDGVINLTGGEVNLWGTGNFGGATGWTFYDLRFGDTNTTSTDTTTAAGAGAVTVSHILTIDIDYTDTGHTLNAGSKTWTLSGTTGAPLYLDTLATFTPNTSTVAFTGNNGSGNTSVPGYSLGISTVTYYNLTINNGSESYIASNLTDVANDFTITAGTFTPSASGMEVAGNWSNAGTFTHNNSTVTFNGAGGSTQEVDGNTTFYNLVMTTASARTVFFNPSTTTTVSGTWTANGAASNLLSLTSLGGIWTINPTAATVSYVSVLRSTNSGTKFCATNSTNAGNNTDWNISTGATCLTNDSLTFTNPYSGTSDTAIADEATAWTFRAVVTDNNGPTNLNYIELRLANSLDSSQPYDALKYRWTEATDAFSEQADTQGSSTITSTSADSNSSSNTWTIDFKVNFNNNFLNKNTAYAAELYVANDTGLTDTDNYANKYKVLGLTLSLSADNASISLGNLLPGSVLTGTTITTVTTNYTNGYALWVEDGVASTNSALLHSDTTTRIGDYAGTITTPTQWTTGSGLGVSVYQATGKDTARWGVGVSEGDSDNKYAGVPQLPAIIHSKTGAPTTSDQTDIGYKVVVANDQKSGDYNGIVTYTVTGVLN